jgi:hypothetical protein
MHVLESQNGLLIVRCRGELGLEELARIAAAGAAARAEGRTVVVDVARVPHLHYAGAALLKGIPGIRLAGASRYLRDLVRAGGAGASVEFHPGVDEALSAS